MKKINLYVLKSYLGPFVLTFFIALFILLMQFLWKYIDDLVGKGLEGGVLAQLLFYASATFVPLALPLAILLSSLMTFGNLGEHYELVAMKASGISVWKVMRPLVVLSVIISILAFLFSNNVLPVANLKFQSLLYDIRQQKLAFNIKPGEFYNGIDNYIIRVGEKGKDGSTIYDVKIYDHTDRMGNIKVTTASSGIMALSPDQKFVIFTLFDGYNYKDIITTRNFRENRPFDRSYFSEQRLKFDLTEFDLTRTQEDMFKNHYTMLNTKQLTQYIDSLNLRYNERKERFTQGFYNRFQYLSTIDTTNKQKKAKHQANKLVPAQVIEDSLHQLNLSYPLLSTFSDGDKFNILEMAISASRNNKDNVLFNKKDFDFQTESIRKHEIVWHKKFTLSIACLILFFVGAPMGAIIRKGGLGLPVVIAVFFFVIYHIASITGEKSAKTGDIDVMLGVWFSSVMLFPLGLFLTFKSTTDAPLLDAESWKKFFNRIFKRSGQQNKKLA
ncbi:MAG TPA: LptF/LptG family permease [Bacteroidales bacterium]|nr:LptF/LptG family permease [Bacteroidales bacterium]